MESFQEEYIRSNLFELVKYTSCDSLLMTFLTAKNRLGDSDIAKLDAVVERYERARKFYEIIIQKDDSYDILRDALRATHQTGALKILNGIQAKHLTTKVVKSEPSSSKPEADQKDKSPCQETMQSEPSSSKPEADQKDKSSSQETTKSEKSERKQAKPSLFSGLMSTLKLSNKAKTTTIFLEDSQDKSIRSTGKTTMTDTVIPFNDFAIDALKAVNLYRDNHDVPPLTLSKDLCDSAYLWASKLARDDDVNGGKGEITFSTRKYGEEVVHHWKYPPNKSQTVIDGWYSYIQYHNFDVEYQSEDHILCFIQIVWKKTKEFGIALATCKNGGCFIVAHYKPGVVLGFSVENVPRPKQQLEYFQQLQVPRCSVTTDNKFIMDALTTHNILRAKHHSPSLALSEDLCRVAQALVNQIAAKNSFNPVDVPFSGFGYGESRYKSSGPVNLGGEVVTFWYSGVEKYNFDWNAYPTDTHAVRFAQVVWKETKEMGIAKAVSEDLTTFVVAIYNPDGIGDFVNNVLRP